MKPTADQVRQADADGASAVPGAENPYWARPVLAAVWMSAHLDGARGRLGIAPGADAPVMPAGWA